MKLQEFSDDGNVRPDVRRFNLLVDPLDVEKHIAMNYPGLPRIGQQSPIDKRYFADAVAVRESEDSMHYVVTVTYIQKG